MPVIQCSAQELSEFIQQKYLWLKTMISDCEQTYDQRLKKIGSLIRTWRELNSDLSQSDLGRLSNLDRKTIYRVEKGFNVNLKSIMRITDILEMDPVELFID